MPLLIIIGRLLGAMVLRSLVLRERSDCDWVEGVFGLVVLNRRFHLIFLANSGYCGSIAGLFTGAQ